ncbi:MAG: DUF1385 domain-containing protein [Dehalococcoidia bacterium]|nr:DUF1385 domain-containing protein [Dehalococcoidia bacterium]
MSAPQTTATNLYYGGQAVLEGVMIRGPEHMAVAVRHPRGHIVRHAERLSGIYTGRARRIPLLRGMIVLWETMVLGMRALSFSSRIAYEDPAAEEGATEFPEKVFWGTMAVALLFVVAVFFAAPILLANILEAFDAHRLVIVGVEGALRLGLFVGYIALIGRLAEIRRVFQYHGAEHMTIHAYEAGRPLTVEAVRPFPKEHTRCGTSFLLVVVLVALVTFFAFDALVDEGLIVRTASRIFLIPAVAGVSYEILRLGARFNGHAVVRAMFIPNIALQALTTKVPDDSQIEVAIASFQAVLEETSRAAPLEVREDAQALAAAPPLD